MRRALSLILSGVLFVGAAGSAQAQTVVKDNSAFGNWGGHFMGGAGPGLSDYSVATKFSTTGVTFDQIRFWGGEDPWWGSYGNSVYYEIMNAVGSSIGSTVTSGNAALSRTGTGNAYGYDTYQYDYSTGAITLSAGDYFLAMHVAGANGLYWQNGVNDAGDQRYQYAGGWIDANDNYYHYSDNAYQFLANDQQVTPEPISMTLLGTGLAGVAAARRRRKQNAAV